MIKYRKTIHGFIYLLIISFFLLCASCSKPYVIHLEGTWANETTTFQITKYEDAYDSFYVLTYQLGDYGMHTFDFDGSSFRFFIRRRVEQQGSTVFIKEYLSDEEVTFKMAYHKKTDKIHLLHLTMNAQPIIFSKIVEETID